MGRLGYLDFPSVMLVLFFPKNHLSIRLHSILLKNGEQLTITGWRVPTDTREHYSCVQTSRYTSLPALSFFTRLIFDAANYDFETVFSILDSTFFSDVSFVITDEDGEPSPFSLPMTAVAGQYDPSTNLPDDDGDEESYMREQESCGRRPFDVYLHGNTAMLLRKMTKSNGSVKVVVSSTKGENAFVNRENI